MLSDIEKTKQWWHDAQWTIIPIKHRALAFIAMKEQIGRLVLIPVATIPYSAVRLKTPLTINRFDELSFGVAEINVFMWKGKKPTIIRYRQGKCYVENENGLQRSHWVSGSCVE